MCWRLLRDSWVKVGVSIFSNRWKDAKNWPLNNVIVVTPKDAMFLRVVDCEQKVKNGQFVAAILLGAFYEVGPHSLVEVIIDNSKL